MHRLASVFLCLVLGAAPALAGSTWTAIGLAVPPEHVDAMIAAMDELNNSAIGKERPGTISLMNSVLDGADPATHTVIVSYDSRAAGEAYTQKLYASEEWRTFQSRYRTLGRTTAASRMNFVKSWGEEDDGDRVWEIYAFTVTDPAGLVAALDALMAAPETGDFPGSVYLSQVAAAGLSDVTHLISVGYQSEAEAEAWGDPFSQTQTWRNYLRAAGHAAVPRGAFLLRTVKTWGED